MNDLKGIIEDCNKSDLVSDKIIKKIIEIIGQEEWQDLHDENNDICTTMGELIITLKGIADLEKENAELKKKCYKKAVKDYCDLEKENAELKEKLKPENCLKLLAKEGYIKFTSEQLTKAKEIIKNLLSAYTTYADSFDDRDNEIVSEAEQFLKDNEVEK